MPGRKNRKGTAHINLTFSPFMQIIETQYNVHHFMSCFVNILPNEKESGRKYFKHQTLERNQIYDDKCIYPSINSQFVFVFVSLNFGINTKL